MRQHLHPSLATKKIVHQKDSEKILIVTSNDIYKEYYLNFFEKKIEEKYVWSSYSSEILVTFTSAPSSVISTSQFNESPDLYCNNFTKPAGITVFILPALYVILDLKLTFITSFLYIHTYNYIVSCTYILLKTLQKTLQRFIYNNNLTYIQESYFRAATLKDSF